jgi:hypothetical protein
MLATGGNLKRKKWLKKNPDELGPNLELIKGQEKHGWATCGYFVPAGLTKGLFLH